VAMQRDIAAKIPFRCGYLAMLMRLSSRKLQTLIHAPLVLCSTTAAMSLRILNSLRLRSI